MGLSVVNDHFEQADYERFRERLRRGLEALRALLERPGFGRGDPSLGAELEMSLVDRCGRPSLINEQIIEELDDDHFTVELNRFNLEYNCRAYPAAGSSFSSIEDELRSAVEAARELCAERDANVALVGILPSLLRSDFVPEAMTDTPRYRALSTGLRKQRSGPFRVRIDGDDPLETQAEDVTLEGAATSLQLHLRVSPESFAQVYNAVQIATAPALAVSANSPTFLGHRLWDETRIALFKQAVDARSERDPPPRIARVCFGTGWVRHGAYDLFEESVRLYAPLLPVLGGQVDPVGVVRAGGVPELGELRLHHGTVWHWNRAIYDPADGGHLRVELRALPSGPTIQDMMANAAFLIGLSCDLANDANAWIAELPFRTVEDNFYRAAQQGPDASLSFLDSSGEARRMRPAELVPLLAERAARGLRGLGVAEADVGNYLRVFAARAETGATGARWQRRALARLGYRLGAGEAMTKMFAEYRARSAEGAPVHTWTEVM